MEFNETRTLADIRRAKTEDLLDRASAFRSGMLPQAIQLIEEELFERGITAEEIQDRTHWYQANCVRDGDGLVQTCSVCGRPALIEVRQWYRWRPGFRQFRLPWGIPLFPWSYRYCREHRPDEK